MAARPAARPWTDADSAEFTRLHGEGKSLHAIAGEMGRPKGTLSKYADQLGLSFDRTRTVKAAEAKAADAKERRAALQVGLLEDATRLRAQLWAETPYAQAVGGQDPQVMRWTMKQPIPADQLKIMQAVGAAIDRSLKLADHDTGTGVTAIVGVLQRTAKALGLNDDTDTQP